MSQFFEKKIANSLSSSEKLRQVAQHEAVLKKIIEAFQREGLEIKI